MLRKIFLLTLIVFVTACSSTNNVPLSVVSTATSISPTATVTSSPVPTATQIPPTPTESIDPETGWKLQIVDGENQLFSPDVNEWVVSGGTAPLLSHAERPYFVSTDAFSLELYYPVGHSGPTISLAPDVTSTGDNFTSIFTQKINLRKYGHVANGQQTMTDVLSGSDVFSIETPQGTFSFGITKDSKYRVYILPPNQMPTGYQELLDTNVNKRFSWLAGGDGKNAIMKISYEGNWKDLDKKTFMKFIMYPLAAMMSQDQGIGLYTNPPSLRPNGLSDYFNAPSLGSFDVSGLP